VKSPENVSGLTSGKFYVFFAKVRVAGSNPSSARKKRRSGRISSRSLQLGCPWVVHDLSMTGDPHSGEVVHRDPHREKVVQR
jgi:hypothetical protein